MSNRLTDTEVTFKQPFLLTAFDVPQEAGIYTVTAEDEQITAVSFPAWRRVNTVMAVHRTGATEYVSIDPQELDEALLRDAAGLAVEMPAKKSRLANRKKY